MNKDFRVSYYQVEITGTERFENFLLRINQIPVERRLGAHNIRMEGINFRPEVAMWEGFIERVRMTNLPEKVNRTNGTREGLPLADDEGLSEVAAFIYKPEQSVLLIQKSQYAPSTWALAEYIQEKCMCGPIGFNCVLKPDVIERLNRISTMIRFEFKTARVNPESLANTTGSTGDFLNSLSLTGYQQADMVLSAKRDSGGLSRWLKTLALAMRRNVTDHVKTIKVTGYDNEGHKDILDILEYKLEDKVTVNVTERTISFEIRRGALYTSYGRYRDVLSRFLVRN